MSDTIVMADIPEAEWLYDPNTHWYEVRRKSDGESRKWRANYVPTFGPDISDSAQAEEYLEELVPKVGG